MYFKFFAKVHFLFKKLIWQLQHFFYPKPDLLWKFVKIRQIRKTRTSFCSTVLYKTSKLITFFKISICLNSSASRERVSHSQGLQWDWQCPGGKSPRNHNQRSPRWVPNNRPTLQSHRLSGSRWLYKKHDHRYKWKQYNRSILIFSNFDWEMI